MRLRRTSPDQPGWTRRRSGRGFTYLDEHGDPLPEEARQRVRDLAIPPAWTDVWITPHENGHLQATGIDAAGRKQYLYHPHWRERRDAEKFDRMIEFGSFGLTPLERRHVRRTREVLVFAFTGKSGVEHRVEVDDPIVIEALQVMRRRHSEDPRLLAYKERNRWRAVLAPMVNNYVRDVTGMEATAKDFRTWHATVLAAAALARTREAVSPRRPASAR